MDKKRFVYQFLNNQELAVISTVSPEGPQSALVGFGENEGLELIFGTTSLTRKYKNLKNDPKVSAVIGWEENKTLQYEGEAEELEGKELEKFRKIYFKKNPKAKKYEDEPGEVYFKITPKWIRYTELKNDCWEVFEITF